MKLRLYLVFVLVSCHFTLSGQYNLNIKRTFSETSHQVICACYSPDGKYIITGGSDNSIIIWNAESGIIYRTLTGLKKRPNTAIISKANDLIISAGEDNIITVWNPSTSLVSFTLSGHTAPVNSLDISPDGKYLASGSTDKTIRIWDLNKRTLIYELKGHKLDVTSVKFSPDGMTLVSGGADKTVILWNIQNGNIILSKKLHSDYIRKVIFSPDGTLIASCGDDKLINISSASDLSIKTTLRGHTDWVQTIDFSPDGSQLISGGHDQLIILWDVASGKILSQSDRQGEKVISVDFCPVRPDFLSAVVRSEIVNTWALPDRSVTQLSAPSEKSVSGPPVVEREVSARKSEMIMAEKTNVASASKSMILKESVTMDEKAFEKMEIPAEKMVISAPVINFFDPVPEGDKVTYEKKNIYLIGRVTGPDPVSSILINKNLIKLSEAGVFEINLSLSKGENPIEMVVVSSRGKMTTKNLIIDCTASDATEQGVDLPDIFRGKYYALIIGVNDYKSDEISDLDKPIKDGESLSKVLLEQYTFEKENIIFLKNPTQSDIITTLDKLSRDITPDDNLLIFYAGHGYWDEKGKVGYWFPSDATRNSTVNWFRNSTLRDFIGSIQSKHTMLIADACFSGAILKTRSAGINAPQGINMLYDSPSRKAMTSGNLLEVPDESIFIQYLVKKLSENKEKFLPAEILYGKIKEAVVNNSTTNPQYGTIQNVGDEGGDFIFIKK